MSPIVLSYIIPVYNTKKWLSECLNSVLAHEGFNIEFIIIDDGSTDGSSELLRSYEEKDFRIKLIKQENKGLSQTRNVGLKYAIGEYIQFVDSDDIINASAVNKMLKIALDTNADIVTGKIKSIDNNGRYCPWGTSLPYKIYQNGFELMEDIISRATYFPMVFGYMVRRELLLSNELQFHPNIIHEDELWTPQVLARAYKVVTTNEYHYLYRINRVGSIMSDSIAFDRCVSIGFIVKALLKEACKNRKALKFYHNRLTILTSLISLLAKESYSLSLVEQLAVGHLYEFYRIFNHEKDFSK